MRTEIHVLNIQAQINNSVEKYLDKFSIERQEKILRYKFNPDRNRTVHAELLAKNLISRITGKSINEIHISRNTNGKPFCNVTGIFFSLSHSGCWVSCSIGTQPNGIDIEIISKKIGLNIAKRFFLSNEYTNIKTLHDNKQNWQKKFLEYWTIKESYLKCMNLSEWSNVDCEKLLNSNENITARNFYLPDESVIGICTDKEFMPEKIFIENF